MVGHGTHGPSRHVAVCQCSPRTFAWFGNYTIYAPLSGTRHATVAQEDRGRTSSCGPTLYQCVGTGGGFRGPSVLLPLYCL